LTPLRTGRLRLALLVAVALVLIAAPAAIAFDAMHQVAATPPRAQHLEAPLAAPRANTRETTPAVAQSTAPQPPAAAQARLADRVDAALTRQEAALVAGDPAGFLAPVDPADSALRGELTRRYNSLRAMQVAVWDETPAGPPTRVADGSWSVPVHVRYCFVVPDCVPLELPVTTRWTDGGTLRLVGFATSKSDDLGPRPWEVSDLRAAVGARVIVATTPRYASRLPAVLTAAEKAASVVDRYARWGKPPGRYVVYIAGPDEWGLWYGIKQQSWVAAFAMPLTDTSTEVVLNVDHVGVRDVTDILRHELTHVVTLAGVGRSYDHSWWLVEGIAEYVRVTGGARPFDGLGDLRKYVYSGRWSGDTALDAPPSDTSPSDVNGRYAVAYLAVKRLADRFGEDRMLDFFAAVARDGQSLAEAAPAVFGVPWDGLATDLTEAVRSTAR
jgi:hypothetical protein